jgi:hypothetical protein
LIINIITNLGDTKAKTMKEFSALLQKRFLQMCKTNKLFVSSISGQRIWNIYLQSFQPEDDPVFRDPESSTHNCNLCIILSGDMATLLP